MSLELEPTTDILAELARSKSSQIIIGFAAETENVLEERAQETDVEVARCHCGK